MKTSALAAAAFVVVALWLALAAAAPLLAPYEPLRQDMARRLAAPSAVHWLGTDALGRDVLSRILHGARISIPVGLAAVTLAALLGALVGGLAGFAGRRLDDVAMRITDLMLAFPTVILALVITAALGVGIRNAVIAIMIAWWPTYARLARGLVLAVREREYVQVAYALGASDGRVLCRYVAPNVLSSIVVLATLDVGHAILTFASLSFLGPRAPARGAGVGVDDRGRPELPRPVVDRDVPGAGDPEPHDRVQHRRRQPPGLPGSPAAEGLRPRRPDRVVGRDRTRPERRPAVIPRRTVACLSVAQLVSWGVSYHLIAVFGETIAADLGWSRPVAYGGLTLALVVTGVCSPVAGGAIDRLGGRPAMVAGSLFNALGCVGVATAHRRSRSTTPRG